jgi:hypothetical protein
MHSLLPKHSHPNAILQWRLGGRAQQEQDRGTATVLLKSMVHLGQTSYCNLSTASIAAPAAALDWLLECRNFLTSNLLQYSLSRHARWPMGPNLLPGALRELDNVNPDCSCSFTVFDGWTGRHSHALRHTTGTVPP